MKRKTTFTLLEILVAVTVFGVSLVMIMAILANARSRLLRAEERWAREHLLTLATEFFLLAGPEATLPEGVFPEGFTATCALDNVEDLPDTAILPVGNTMLKVYRVRVYGTGSELIGERTVEKVVYEHL